MPELPEVETVRRSLIPRVEGRTIVAVDVRERRLRRPLPADFAAALRGARIESVERRGKYLLLHLDRAVEERALLIHLGMSGSLVVRPRASAFRRHDHVALHLDSGCSVVLNDARRFGLMRVGRIAEFAELRNVGRDPLATPLSAAEWRALVRDRRLPIKSLLMDQKVLAGIGNIYANEMLYEAGIRPRRRAANLRGRELERLDGAMRRVLGEAVRLGGSSISDFRDAGGNPGYFQIQHAVYDRGGAPCPRCAAPIRRVVLSGRSTFYCPTCQS